MVKMVGGTIACSVSQFEDGFYCDYCGEFFENRDDPPCEQHGKPYGLPAAAAPDPRLVLPPGVA